MKTIKIYLFLILFLIINSAMAQVKKDICLNSEKSSQSLGGIASEGNLQVVLYDNSNMQVFKYASGLWVNQWYGTSSKSIWLYAGGTAYKAVGGYYSGTSTLLTTVSNSKVDANTNELILEKAGKIRIKQTTFYPANSAIVYYKWDITNLSDTTINDFRMFSGGDTYLGGNDFGPGFWLPTENAVGVKKIIGNKMQKLEMQGITIPYAYDSRYYVSVYQSIVSNALLNLIDTSETTDNALALEYRIASLAAGETWTIQAIEKFNSVPITDVIVTAPISAQVEPGASINLDFTVKNRTAYPTTLTLTKTVDLAGWSVALASPSSTFTLPANATQIVHLTVTCPQGTPIETTAKVTLNAINGNGTASDFCNVMVVELPSITAQPSSQNLCMGLPASFSLTANNANTYQWQEYTTDWNNLSSGGIYSGTNTPNLNISSIEDSLNNHQYRCNVTNSFGNVVSDDASLTIVYSTSIIEQPIASNICEGENTSFNITATGTAITYQWLVNDGFGFININNNNIYSGANSNILNISSATTNMNGYEYKCEVSGACYPNPISNVAVLSVYSLPNVELGNDTILSENQSITLDAGAGSNYTWSDASLNGRIVTIDAALMGLGTHEISVTVTNSNGCVDVDSIEITFTTFTGTNNYTQTSSINIQPNPTSGIVSIIFPSIAKDTEIEIYNIQGKIVKKEKVNDVLNTPIDMSNVAKGAYTVKIISNNQIVNKKLIVN
ncbi:MAG: hypothetical protein AUJ97_04285 [Bacteroidetes bacterium CG2_30_32_10]|nr:MAG: hypothetical protein AUJ97_04285 [Bacteroidetes bacterium CG2_30_32_10]